MAHTIKIGLTQPEWPLEDQGDLATLMGALKSPRRIIQNIQTEFQRICW